MKKREPEPRSANEEGLPEVDVTSYDTETDKANDHIALKGEEEILARLIAEVMRRRQ
jgi:hypothetical protein